jgi:hypothetical protein
MVWAVLYADEFVPEVERFAAAVRVELLARADVLAEFGPALGRAEHRFYQALIAAADARYAAHLERLVTGRRTR